MTGSTSLLLLAAVAAAARPDWTPGRDEVRALESRLTLPAGAVADIGRYERSYAGTREGDARLIVGALRVADKGGATPGVHIVPLALLPKLADAGCRLVRLVYAVDEQRFRSIDCGATLRRPARPAVRTAPPGD